jgi:hypothetical protein
MASGGTSIRRYVGAIKDSTTVGIAKVNSDYKVTTTMSHVQVRFYQIVSHHFGIPLRNSEWTSPLSGPPTMPRVPQRRST